MENNKEYQEHLEKVKENGYYLAYVPEEFKEELAEKYDIDLPKKIVERGR